MLRAHETYYYQCNCNRLVEYGAVDFIGHGLDCNIVERASAMAENYRNFAPFIAQSETEVACNCSANTAEAGERFPHTPACHVIQNAELNEQAALIV